jgi:hypothetical protein
VIRVAAANRSSLSAAEVTEICRALSIQGTHHIAPAWDLTTVSVQVRAQLATDWLLVFGTDSPTEGALGDHEDQASGAPILNVYVNDCTRDGVSPSACASHELAEAMVDPYLTTANFDGRSKFYATEVGDPAQGSTYSVDGIEVQDFALPAWFNSKPLHGAKFSHTGFLTAPFEIGHGGYSQYIDLKDPGKGWQQVGLELGTGHSRPSRRRKTLPS